MEAKTIIIIGGLSAGPSAAAKARRINEKAKILLFEKDSDISYATCGMPYALSGVIASRDDLIVVKPELLRDRFKIEMHLNEEVTDVNVDLKSISTPKGKYKYDKLIIATGARSILPPIKHINEATNWSFMRTLNDFDKIIYSEVFQRSRNVAIIGGGLIGIEVAENLKELNKKVSIVEAAPQLLTQWSSLFANFAKQEIINQKIDVYLGQFVTETILNENRISSLLLADRTSINVDYVILSAGIRANSELLAKHKINTLANGAIVVNDKMETSIQDIYAAGDCASIINQITQKNDYLPLGTHSNKAGRTAGANAAGENEIYKGGYGTAIIKIFDYTLARTGLSQKTINEEQIAVKKAYINASATPSYYPNAENMVIEITYDSENSRLLAVEIFGKHGVDKRIDVFATAIYASLKVGDLPHLDLAYAPPFSPAKDPVVVAGFVASNHISHKCTPITTEKLKEKLINPTKIQLIDLRNSDEIESNGKIEGSINIALDDLRKHLAELSAEKEIILYCAKGLRGYLASLILRHNGFDNATNLAGGFSAWQMDNRI